MTTHAFPLLRSDLFVKNIGTGERCKELLEYAQSIKANPDNAGLDLSNNGCWRHQFNYPDIDWIASELTVLAEVAVNSYLQSDPLYTEKVDRYGQPIFSYWTNINEPMSRNVLHDHRTSQYVGIYYIQGTDTGDIVFHNPTNVTESCNSHAPFVSRYAYKPKDGDLVLWPAWMPHETETNRSSRQRINIAFNISYQGS